MRVGLDGHNAVEMFGQRHGEQAHSSEEIEGEFLAFPVGLWRSRGHYPNHCVDQESVHLEERHVPDAVGGFFGVVAKKSGAKQLHAVGEGS